MRWFWVAVVGLVGGAALLGAAHAGEEEASADAVATLGDVRVLLARGDSYAAAERIQRDGTTAEVVRRYVAVVDGLYWQVRDLPGCVAVGRAGTLYCLTRAQDAADEEERRRLRVAAQEMSFNVASSAWPGWAEKGIEIGPVELAAALDLARLDLRLVRELGYPPEKHANAHWIVGAQLLAAGRLEEARAEFVASRESAREAGAADKQSMADGYVGIVDALAHPDDSAGEDRVAAAREHLAALATDDATFLADQLMDVLRYFRAQ